MASIESAPRYRSCALLTDFEVEKQSAYRRFALLADFEVESRSLSTVPPLDEGPVMIPALCVECGTEAATDRPPFFAPGICSPGCAPAPDEARPRWSPRAASAAAEQVARTVRDPSRCLECGGPMPSRTGKRGRPRVSTCLKVWPDGRTCGQRYKARRDVFRRAHLNVAEATCPDSISPRSRGAVIVASDVDRGAEGDRSELADLSVVEVPILSPRLFLEDVARRLDGAARGGVAGASDDLKLLRRVLAEHGARGVLPSSRPAYAAALAAWDVAPKAASIYGYTGE